MSESVPGAGLPTAPAPESVPRSIARFLADLWRITIFQPVRHGTLDLGAHSRPVAGIAWGVALLYAVTVASIVLAGPLRSSSPFLTSIGSASALVVPVFLIPGVLCLLATSFGLLLAGSQRAPWWRRLLYLIVVLAVLTTMTAVSASLGSSSTLTWISAGFIVAVLAYVVLMWFVATPAGLDAVILVILTSGTLLAAYRSLITQTLLGGEGGIAVTAVVVVLSQVASLALPVAFLSGVNATALGASVISWAGEQLGLRTVVWVAATVVAVGLVWQWVTVVSSVVTAPDGSGLRFTGLLTAAALVAICSVVWFLCRRGGGSGEQSPDDSPVAVTEAGVSVAVPVSYGTTAPGFIGALLAALIFGLQGVAPSGVVDALEDILGATTSLPFTIVIRSLVVVGLAVGAVVLLRRESRLLAACAGIFAVVLGTYYLRPLLPEQLSWTPSSLGDVGLVVATVFAVVWASQRRWDRGRSAILVLLVFMSALVRQANFFEVPLGFVIGASATAVLIVGLVWGFLTDAGHTHEGSPRFPRDRQLLVMLGTFLFGITFVAWSVLAKDVERTTVLSEVSLLAVETIGSGIIIAVVLAAVPLLRKASRGDVAPEPPAATSSAASR